MLEQGISLINESNEILKIVDGQTVLLPKTETRPSSFEAKRGP